MASTVPSSVHSSTHKAPKQHTFAKARPKKEVASDGAVAVTISSSGHSFASETQVNASGVSTGRWTEEEHRLFLTSALEHGKNWKMISRLVKTRTAVQVQTHAQKYMERWMRQKQAML